MNRKPSIARPATRRAVKLTTGTALVLGLVASSAALISPRTSTAATDSVQPYFAVPPERVARSHSTLREDLRYVRTQLSAFKHQHRSVMPGYPRGDRKAVPDEATLLEQMLGFSDEFCTTSRSPSPTARYGPYLTRMPVNPINRSARVLVVNGPVMPQADESTGYGWIYNPKLEKFQANLEGSDSGGTPYAAY